jgi:hypothetical protein
MSEDVEPLERQKCGGYYCDEEVGHIDCERQNDPNQCPDCGDNLDEFDLCVSCDY